jgi:CRISPR-associated protein Csm3
MLKRLLNQAEIEIRIDLDGPLLIKSGQPTVTGTDMAFILTYKDGVGRPVIPGSSLKGALRSHAERLCRSLARASVCEPYWKAKDHSSERPASCGLRMDAMKSPPGSVKAYKHSCPACRLFGSTHFRGRFATADAYGPDEQDEKKLELRDGVAIDRYTGGAFKGAKFDLEVLPEGYFKTRIQIENFERWQLALVALVLRDFEEGLIRLGSGRSRGLGQVKARVEQFKLRYFGKRPQGLVGLSKQVSDRERKDYALDKEAQAIPLPEGQQRGLRYDIDLGESWRERLEATVDDLEGALKASKWLARLDEMVEANK